MNGFVAGSIEHMSYTRGKPLYPEKEKKLLISVEHHFDGNRIESGSSDPAVQMAVRLNCWFIGSKSGYSKLSKDPDSINAPQQSY